MFAKFRILLSRRLVLAVAAYGAMSCLGATGIQAQMCASGGSTGGTGTSTGTTTGTSSSRGTGSTSSGSNTVSLFQAAQTAHQLQMMAEQESRVQAYQAMQAMQYEAAANIANERQIELHRTARLANAQKQREMRAARSQRKPARQSPRPETEVRTASR